jgi:hypothetical protein
LFPAKHVRRSTLAFALAVLLIGPRLCLAQDTPPEPDPGLQQRYDELVVWLAEYASWEEWMLKWGNRVAFNSAGGIIKERPIRPEPPEWLAADCEQSLSTEGKLAEACSILSRWDGISQLILSQKHLGGLKTTDVERKTSFLQRVHLSGGWVPAQLPAPAVADGEGGYEWKPATIFGIGYRLTSFGFPWVNREANLHFNIARATIHGASNLPIGFDPSQNLIGFSLTFAKR